MTDEPSPSSTGTNEPPPAGPDDCAEHMLLQARAKGFEQWTNIYAAQLAHFATYCEVRAIARPVDAAQASPERGEPVALTGTVHKLKTWPEYFNEVLSGRKPFEWRVDDRDFKIGDTLVLQEYIPHPENPGREGEYTGREITKTVSYIFSPWATNKRTVVMGLALPSTKSGGAA